jgi:hypothetical protein
MSMKNLLLLLLGLGLAISACHKNEIIHYPLSAQLKATFGYKIGSYWVYRDSVSGEIDSFYVQNSAFCTQHSYGSDVDRMDIAIRCMRSSPVDSEFWLINLIDSTFSIDFLNHSDYIQARMHFFLFSYPFMQRPAGGGYDSGYVSNIFSTYNVNGQAHNNVILSYHTNSRRYNPSIYEDEFYVSSISGIVKVIFNHPQDSTFRVLELQKWNIIR